MSQNMVNFKWYVKIIWNGINCFDCSLENSSIYLMSYRHYLTVRNHVHKFRLHL